MEPGYTPQQQPVQQEGQRTEISNPLPQPSQPQVSGGNGSMKKSYSIGKKRLGVLVGSFVAFGIIAGVTLLIFSRAGTSINSRITLDKATWQFPADPITSPLVGLRADVQIKKLNTDTSSNFFYAAQTNTVCPASSGCPELTVGIRTSTQLPNTEKRSVATFTIKQVPNLQEFSSSTTADKPAYKAGANSSLLRGENALTIAVPISLAEGAVYKLGIDDGASDNRLYWTAWVESSGSRITIGRFYPVRTQSPSDNYSLNGTSTLHSRLYGPTESCDKISASSVTFSNILMVRVVDRSALYANSNTHTTDQTCPDNNKVTTTASSYLSSVAPVPSSVQSGASPAQKSNPVGYIDYCSQGSGTTVLYGWAYDPDGGATDGAPSVNLRIGSREFNAIPTDLVGYRTAEIDAFLNSNGYAGKPRGTKYGFKKELTGISADGAISGTIANIGGGTSVPIGINTGTTSILNATDGPTRYLFANGKIPSGCASTATATQTTPPTPPGAYTGGDNKVDGYIDYCTLENNKTVLYGWAYDSANGATDEKPLVKLKVGSNDYDAAPTDRLNYRTEDINDYLDFNRINGARGTAQTSKYGFRKEVSSSGTVSGKIISTYHSQETIIKVNVWKDFGAGKFKFGSGGMLPSGCLPTTSQSGSQTTSTSNPVGYIDYCKPNGTGKTLLYGWAYDPDAADDASPTVEIKIGTSTKSGITTGTSYRTQDIDSFLDGNGYAGKPRGNRMYGFAAEVPASSGDAISGTITNIGSGSNTSLQPNSWKNFDTGTFIFEGNKIPTGCINTSAPAPSSTNNNPVGYIDYCKPASNGQFTVYGWAYDPDSSVDTAPLVNITIAGNQYTQIPTDKSYRTMDINQFLDQSGYQGKPRGNRLYGFSRIMSGSTGSQISGLVFNEGGGSNAALPANDWKEFGSGTYKFEGGKIPSGCATASSSTSSTGTPLGYLDSCTKNGSTTTLKGWAYDPDGAPALLINVGNLSAGATANASGYRTDAVNAFLGSVYPGKTRYNAYGFTVSFSGLSKSTTYDVRGTIIDTGKGNEFQPLGINYVNTESSVLLGGSAITDGQLPDACLN